MFPLSNALKKEEIDIIMLLQVKLSVNFLTKKIRK